MNFLAQDSVIFQTAVSTLIVIVERIAVQTMAYSNLRTLVLIILESTYDALSRDPGAKTPHVYEYA